MNDNKNIFKTGNTYLVPAENIKFDKIIAGFNPVKGTDEFESLKEQIKKDGQLQPIYIRNGLCIDGRHRTKACIELGIQIKCVDVLDNLSNEQCVRISNTNVFGSRNDGPNQLAIKAYKLVKDFKYKDKQALELVALSASNGRVLLSAIRYIIDNDYEWVIDKVLAKENCHIKDNDDNIVYRGQSLRKLKAVIADIESEKDYDDDDYLEPVIDYNSIIKSEKDRIDFWNRFGKNKCLTIDEKVYICNLYNRGNSK